MGNEVYVKANLKNHLESIKPAGFVLNSFENEFYYEKNETGKRTTIWLYYREYFPHGVHFHGCSASIAFSAVEQIYHNIVQNHPATNYGSSLSYNTTFEEDFEDVIGDDNEEYISSVEVSDDATFNLVKPFLEQMLNAALQFLKQHNTLQDYYNYVESLDLDSLGNFYAQPLPPRRMIVKKLVNAPDFNAYATGLIDRYTNQYNKPAVASFLQALKNHLDTL